MKEIKNLETERTIMRKLTTEDAKDFYALNLDEEVLKYTGDKPFENIQASIDFLTNYDQYEKYGVGRLAVIDKTTLKFLGWCGLKYSQDKNEYDIGFRFYRNYWNKGFATETAKKKMVKQTLHSLIIRAGYIAAKLNVCNLLFLKSDIVSFIRFMATPY